MNQLVKSNYRRVSWHEKAIAKRARRRTWHACLVGESPRPGCLPQTPDCIEKERFTPSLHTAARANCPRVDGLDWLGSPCVWNAHPAPHSPRGRGARGVHQGPLATASWAPTASCPSSPHRATICALRMPPSRAPRACRLPPRLQRCARVGLAPVPHQQRCRVTASAPWFHDCLIILS